MSSARCSICGAPTAVGEICEACTSSTVVQVCDRCGTQIVHFRGPPAPPRPLCWACECEDRLLDLPADVLARLDAALGAGHQAAAAAAIGAAFGCSLPAATECAEIRRWQLRRAAPPPPPDLPG